MPLSGNAGSKLHPAKFRGHRLALAPSSPILFFSRLTWVTVQLDFRASANASQRKRGVESAVCKVPWAPPGLGARVPDLVFFEVDVGDRAVALQGICQCLEEMGGQNCKLKRPRGHRLALAPSSPILLFSRLTWVTVLLDFKASASAYKKRGVETAS